jgi:tetratricopeptide (TPR) repeat protein
MNLGDYEEAMKDFNRAIELDPELPDAYRNRAEFYIKLGERDDALNDAQTALELSDSTDEEAKSLMLFLIAKILLNEDISGEEKKYRELCAEEFETGWSFRELDEWLEDADIEDDKEEKIREIIDLLREHKPDYEE